MRGLNGKVTIVNGGPRGIGYAYVERLLVDGLKFCLNIIVGINIITIV
ncbi:MAG: hypothetical protein ACYCXQ_13085 [Candidatus Humimicrobiaceae bacterium]